VPTITVPDSFTFVAKDPAGALSDPAPVNITVNPVNDAPTADDQSVTTDEDTALGIALTGADVEGDALTYAVASAPSHGNVVISGSTATYTPNANYHGPDSFTFVARIRTDAQSAPATVNITVNPVNDAPVVVNPIGEVRALEDGPDVVVDVAVAFADVDIVTSGDSLTFQLVGIDKDNPGLFSSESFTGSTLAVETRPRSVRHRHRDGQRDR
jgi:large repetitive protein